MGYDFKYVIMDTKIDILHPNIGILDGKREDTLVKEQKAPRNAMLVSNVWNQEWQQTGG